MKAVGYILRGREVVPTDDVLEWATWFETSTERIIKQESACRGGPGISTVFLGVDHNFHGSGPPLLFETMTFGGLRDGDTQRYATYEDAERGHARAAHLARVWRGGRRVKARVLKRQVARTTRAQMRAHPLLVRGAGGFWVKA